MIGSSTDAQCSVHEVEARLSLSAQRAGRSVAEQEDVFGDFESEEILNTPAGIFDPDDCAVALDSGDELEAERSASIDILQNLLVRGEE